MTNSQQPALSDAEIAALSNSVPPPPYDATIAGSRSGGNYDLTPTPHHINRPRLPEDKRNPHLNSLPEDVTIVKFQTIVREGKEIIVGRVKVPTPNNTHAFILRRYDTQAISLTTMFKVAFPTAGDEEEKHEMDWVRSSFDTSGTNGSRDCDVVRLAGQWVSRHLALHLSPAYGIQSLVHALARAQPDPSVSYRKSQRSQAAADELARQRTGTTRVVPSLTAPAAEAQPTPKRRRTAQPSTPSAGESSAAPAAAGQASASASPSSRRVTVQATTTVTAPVGAHIDMESEIAQAKQLVKDLKRELQLRAAAGEELEEQGAAESSESANRGTKRGATDDGVDLPSGSVARSERVIRTNRRVAEPRGGVVPVVKQAAFGAMLFGLGAAAAAYLPQVLPQVSQYAAQFL